MTADILPFLLAALIAPPAGPTPGVAPASAPETTRSEVAAEPGEERDADQSNPGEDQGEETVTVYDLVTIVGNETRARELPGSAWTLGRDRLDRQRQTDILRVLQQIPGVAVQEEDGLGLRPNIGIRGTGVERSQKITLLEDGVLIAPAPYTAPSAYYFPTTARMETVEVRKGSVSIVQGPYTTGGALNLISRSVPGKLSLSAHLAAGENDDLQTEAWVGDSRERFGWLVDLYRSDSDGFKELDGPLDDTGTLVEDVMAKFRVNTDPAARRHQQFELKLGATDQFGRETYLGLTQADFDARPFRRYAGSALDSIDAEHEQVQGRWFLHAGPSTQLVVTAYRNDFFRDWFKNEKTLGVSNADVLADPDRYPLELAILRGEVDSGDDALTLRHNRRNYRSQGIQSLLTWSAGSGRHDLTFGVRHHEDEEDRFQDEELFRMEDAALVRTSVGEPGSQTNRLSDARASSAYVEDLIQLGRFSVRTGLRYESIDYRRFDYSTADPDRSDGPTRLRENGVDVLIPGIAIAWEVDAGQRLFLGLHRGFSPPGAGRTEDTREEESVNLELGWRRFGPRWSADVIAFATDYDNLLGTETVAGGGGAAGEIFNGGEVEVRGLELAARSRALAGNGWSLPIEASYSWTHGEFETSFESSFADWEPRVEIGDELPYLPEHQLQVSVGYERNRFSVFTATSWAAETRSRAGQGPIAADETIDERLVVDATARWRFDDRWSLFLQARNLLDETYLVARRPYGLRPGLDRTVFVGLDLDF